MKNEARFGRGGFTLLEAVIAMALFAIVAVNVTLLVRATEKSDIVADALTQLDVVASQTLDRIALALMAAQQEAMNPMNAAPMHSTEINYQTVSGIENGEVVWGDPESIALDLDGLEVVWRRNPETEEEARVVWGKYVAAAAIGETLENVEDDNGNGLIDEYGLAFHLADDARSVLIQLSLAQINDVGERIETAAEARVAFRN